MFTKFFFSEERDLCLKEMKLAIAGGADIAVPDEYRYLASEWRQSASAGIPASADRLTEDARDLQTFDRVNAFHRFRLAYLDDYYTRRDEAIGALGCAIYYLDNQYSIYRKGGDPELVAYLRERGLRLGTTLSPKNVGVCAANLAEKYPGRVICRMGNENYMSMFSDYACFAYYWNDEFRGVCGTLLAVIPAGRCGDDEQNIIEFLLKVESVTHEIYYPFNKKKNDLIEAWEDSRMTLELFLDEHGQVVYASRHFQDIFGKHIDPGPPPSISQLMPELSYLTDLFDEERNPCQTREVMLLNAEKKYGFLTVIPELIRTERGQKGLHCLLQLSSSKKKAPAPGSENGADCKYSFDDIVGESAAMLSIKEYSANAAASNSNILLLGESGTGKELFAQAIHLASKKKDGPFIPINCASLPKDLLNSELFGYEEGAFTGARKGGAPGKFELANGGTIFLDEIGDMPLEMQSALLRVLEDNTVIRVGGKKYTPVDVRVIAATNQNLWSNVQKGAFRADLYFRLNIVTVRIPPLRERTEDIPLLTDSILERIRHRGGGNRRELSPELIELFKSYGWPGNVRELRNMVERCLSYSGSRQISPEQLPPDLISMLSAAPPSAGVSIPAAGAGIHTSGTATPAAGIATPASSADSWRGYDRERVMELMRKNNGNKSKVAQELGISRATFYKRLKEYGLE